jgi:hypothetical protein
VQENLLDNFPNAPLHVYAVWTPILGRDTREGWEPTLLYDRRVTHYWDADNDVSRWMGRQPDFDDYPDPLVWDVYALYHGDARWENVEQAPWPLEGFGWTVADRSANLAIAAIPLLEDWWRAFLPLGVAPRQPGDPRLLLAPPEDGRP